MNNENKENMELKHDPVPGYRTVFYIVFGIGLLYLGLLFFI